MKRLFALLFALVFAFSISTASADKVFTFENNTITVNVDDSWPVFIPGDTYYIDQTYLAGYSSVCDQVLSALEMDNDGYTRLAAIPAFNNIPLSVRLMIGDKAFMPDLADVWDISDYSMDELRSLTANQPDDIKNFEVYRVNNTAFLLFSTKFQSQEGVIALTVANGVPIVVGVSSQGQYSDSYMLCAKRFLNGFTISHSQNPDSKAKSWWSSVKDWFAHYLRLSITDRIVGIGLIVALFVFSGIVTLLGKIFKRR